MVCCFSIQKLAQHLCRKIGRGKQTNNEKLEYINIIKLLGLNVTASVDDALQAVGLPKNYGNRYPTNSAEAKDNVSQ
jgi:hypothetical protein